MVTRSVSSDDYSGPDRRLAGNGLGGVPAWARFIAIIGIPGAIAIYLVWVGAQLAPRIVSQVDANAVRLAELLKAHDAQSEELRKTKRLLQRMCVTLAKADEEARERCFDD